MTAPLDMIRGRSNIVTLTNNSGGALVAGDVCVQDATGDEYATTTTSAASVLKVFVAAESIASAATGKFYESGYCPLVNVNASVTRGRFLFTHTVAKQAAENATYGTGAFGKILKSGTTPSAIIYSATAQTPIAGAMVLIQEKTCNGSTATETFNTNVAGYRALRLLIWGRTTQTGSGNADIYIQFNGDTAANYDQEYTYGVATTTASAEQIGTANPVIGALPQTSVTAGLAGSCIVDIPYYGQTSFHKCGLSRSTSKTANAGGGALNYSSAVHWRATTAITAVLVGVLTSGNFASGTMISLYGIT